MLAIRFCDSVAGLYKGLIMAILMQNGTFRIKKYGMLYGRLLFLTTDDIKITAVCSLLSQQYDPETSSRILTWKRKCE